MFVVILEYVADLTDIDAALTDHVAWLDEHYESGLFLASGRREPRTGGVIFATGSRAQVDAAVAADPFAVGNLARHTIIEFHPSKFADVLSSESVRHALA